MGQAVGGLQAGIAGVERDDGVLGQGFTKLTQRPARVHRRGFLFRLRRALRLQRRPVP